MAVRKPGIGRGYPVVNVQAEEVGVHVLHVHVQHPVPGHDKASGFFVIYVIGMGYVEYDIFLDFPLVTHLEGEGGAQIRGAVGRDRFGHQHPAVSLVLPQAHPVDPDFPVFIGPEAVENLVLSKRFLGVCQFVNVHHVRPRRRHGKLYPLIHQNGRADAVLAGHDEILVPRAEAQGRGNGEMGMRGGRNQLVIRQRFHPAFICADRPQVSSRLIVVRSRKRVAVHGNHVPVLLAV